MYTVYKGIWWYYNKFETEDGKMINIFPYGMTGDKYKPRLPIHCFIMIDKNHTLKEIVEV